MRSQDPCKNLVLELVSFNTMIQFVLLVDLGKLEIRIDEVISQSVQRKHVLLQVHHF